MLLVQLVRISRKIVRPVSTTNGGHKIRTAEAEIATTDVVPFRELDWGYIGII